MKSACLQDQSSPLAHLHMCQHYLLKVSRTFALNIGFLKHEPYVATLTGYLFCRIIDTIEDSTVLSPAQKIELLEEWSSFFGNEDWEEPLLKWQQKIKSFSQKDLTDNTYETQLIHDASHAFKLFEDLHVSLKNAMVPWVKEMARGMAFYQNRYQQKQGTLFQLEDMDDLEHYCYFVAGTVGEFLKEIMLHSIKRLSPQHVDHLKEYAVPFGLGLQLTNILKDIRVDAKRNWCFIPKSLVNFNTSDMSHYFQDISSQMPVYTPLIERTREHLNKALKFCLSLPRCEREFRIFCLVPLKLALQTLHQLEKDIAHDLLPRTKIVRRQVFYTLWHSRLTFFSNTLQIKFCTQQFLK